MCYYLRARHDLLPAILQLRASGICSTILEIGGKILEFCIITRRLSDKNKQITLYVLWCFNFACFGKVQDNSIIAIVNFIKIYRFLIGF